MPFLIVIFIAIGAFLVGNGMMNPQAESIPTEEIPIATPTPSPSLIPIPTLYLTPKPTTKPNPSVSTPTPIPDYLSKLTKCLKDMENDPLNQKKEEITHDLTNQISTIKEKATQENSSPMDTLAKISRAQATVLAELDTINITLISKYDCFGNNFSSLRSDDIEEAWLIKDINSGDSVIIERKNGEQWLLEAKTWCSWCWRNEGRQILLKFGYTTSKLINDDGDVSEFWTEDEL